jgi:hypothetical protein
MNLQSDKINEVTESERAMQEIQSYFKDLIDQKEKRKK